jgi:hypothetical protein
LRACSQALLREDTALLNLDKQANVRRNDLHRCGFGVASVWLIYCGKTKRSAEKLN